MFSLISIAVVSLQNLERPSSIRMTDATELGIPMTVTGRVVDKSKLPIRSVKVYVYQTDASGRYSKPGESGHRINGTMWTDSSGRFTFKTVRPGPYSGTRSGEHFHFELSEGGIEKHFAGIEFYDDRPKNKMVVYVGRQGQSARYSVGSGWTRDASNNGQRLSVEFQVGIK